MVMVDDSHAVGVLGAHGCGTPEQHGVVGRVDVLTGTLGKALGGGSGGYTSASAEIVALLRQRSRPYLFSNSVLPPVVGAALKSLEILGRSTELRDRLEQNTKYLRAALTDAGFNIMPGIHPITPIMLGDAKLATQMAAALLEQGVYVVGFSYPVVPQGKARIRVQVSAAHSHSDLQLAVSAFSSVKQTLGI